MLRLMRGVQRVFSGPLVVVDTEAGRSKKYSPRTGETANPDHPLEPTYDFERIDLDAPFRGDRCWAAIQQGLALKPAALGFDNLSDEHVSEGGYLDWHDKEVERVGGNEWAAWARPSAARKKLLSGISHVAAPPVLFFTFISEEKTEQITIRDDRTGREKKKVVNKGWTPVAPLLTLKTLDLTIVLPWDSKGIPIWKSRDLPAEDFMRKWPDHLLALMKPGQITEDHGEALGRWVKGEVPSPALPTREDFLAEIKSLLATLPTQEAKKAAVAKVFNLPWAKVERLDILALSDGLQKLRSALRSPAEPVVVPVGDHRDRIRGRAEQAGLPAESIAAVIGGSLNDLPADLETMAIAKIGEWSDEKGA